MELALRALRAKNNEEEFTSLLNEYRPFLLKQAYENTGRYITESDEEYAIVLSAFHEAVKNYDPSSSSFLSYVRLVVSRRLIDYGRETKKHGFWISLDRESKEEDPEVALILRKEMQVSMEKQEETARQEEMKEEINAVQNIFKGYGFSFFALAKVSPKAEKTKTACADAVICLLDDHELYIKMQEKKVLPIAEIEKRCGIPRKILERHRKYIIAAAEIFAHEFPLLQSYMSFVRRRKWQKEAEG